MTKPRTLTTPEAWGEIWDTYGNYDTFEEVAAKIQREARLCGMEEAIGCCRAGRAGEKECHCATPIRARVKEVENG